MTVPVKQRQKEVNCMNTTTLPNCLGILSRRVTRNNPRDQTYNNDIQDITEVVAQCILIL